MLLGMEVLGMEPSLNLSSVISLVLALPEREEVLSVFKMLAKLGFQYRGMESFGFLLPLTETSHAFVFSSLTLAMCW